MDTRTWAYTVRGGRPHGEIFASPEDVPEGWTRRLAEAEAWVSRSEPPASAPAIAKGMDEDAERADLKATLRAANVDIPRGRGATMERLRAMVADLEAKADGEGQ